MSNDRTAGTWDQIKSKLSAHWGKLTVEDLCHMRGRDAVSARTPPAGSEADALTPDQSPVDPFTPFLTT